MPRNSSGNYTLPSSINPVVPNTPILASWANPTLTDVAQGVTDSLDRQGRGSMLAPLKLAAGSEASPGLSFATESSSGLYHAGAGDLRVAVLGQDEIQIEANLVTLPGDLVVGGTATADSAVLDTELATLGQVKEATMASAEEEDVASASTTTLGGLGTNKLRITGTTTITSFGTVYEGPLVVRFAGVLTLTHNASTLILPTAANITTAAGDRAIVSPIGAPSAGWQVVAYQRADGSALSTAGVLAVANGGTGRSDGSNLYDTGDIKYSVRTTAPSGWVKANGFTIGNAASGATNRANADTEALFTLLWNETTQATLPIQTSTGAASTRGANAAADFAADKRMPLPDIRGEAIRGLDDGRGVDVSRANLSSQLDSLQGHTHNTNAGPARQYTNAAGTVAADAVTTASTGPQNDGVNGPPRVSSETRMRNVAATVYIKL